jgi:Zn-dependent peptidase ImmA (M78 family)
VKRHDYYEELKSLARQVREKYGLRTPRVMRSDLRRIYKALKIKFEKWPLSPRVRGAYFNDDCGIHIVIAESLPDDPAVFTMAHELKHHLADADSGLSFCSSANEKEPIEIGAEVFAAELIFPEADFVVEMRALGVEPGGCTPEHIVRLKERTKTTLSHRGLCKRAERLGFAVAGALDRVLSWTAVRDRVFGAPPWRRPRP